MWSEKMVVRSEAYQKHGGDAGGDSILSGFGSSSGSSTTDETCEEEALDELTRQITAHMFLGDDEIEKDNQHRATLFQPTNVLENQGKKLNRRQKDVKKAGDGGGRAAIVSPNGSGMRALFPAESGPRKGSGGTGVFIPRVTNPLPNHHLRRRRGGGSRVIIPERVLNSLKQHHENMSANQANQAAPAKQAAPNPVSPARPNEGVVQRQEAPSKEVVKQSKKEEDVVDYDDEFNLPQEWTY